MRTFLISLTLLESPQLNAKKGKPISGFMTDNHSGELLTSVAIQIVNSNHPKGAMTHPERHFSIENLLAVSL